EGITPQALEMHEYQGTFDQGESAFYIGLTQAGPPTEILERGRRVSRQIPGQQLRTCPQGIFFTSGNRRLPAIQQFVFVNRSPPGSFDASLYQYSLSAQLIDNSIEIALVNLNRQSSCDCLVRRRTARPY